VSSSRGYRGVPAVGAKSGIITGGVGLTIGFIFGSFSILR
jgi:hypothetical protein